MSGEFHTRYNQVRQKASHNSFTAGRAARTPR